MGNLFQDDNDSNSGKHSLDYRGGEVIADDPSFKDTEQQLNGTSQHNGQQEILVSSQGSNGGEYNGRKSCGRATHTYL